MSYKIVPTARFKKEAKRLSKKFPSLKAELATLNELLTNQPDLGHLWATTAIRYDLQSGTKEKVRVAVGVS